MLSLCTSCTRSLPHYYMLSDSEHQLGPLRVIRKGLIEDVYGPLRYMFPDAAAMELPPEQ